MTPGKRSHLIPAAAALVVLCAPFADAHAQFSHQVPFKLPKGANGMQPDLALVYLPGASNGIVGVGWQLSGLSTITRASYGNGINYDGADTYAHSQSGVLVPQTDGSYRSKKESFTKLVPSGTCGDGPCSWVAYDRSGTKFHFGTTPDSRLVRQGTSSVRTWALAAVVDLFGNSFEVEYWNDGANGVIYPSVIAYTKGPGLTTYRTVEFAYEPRADVEPGYGQSAFEQTLFRLKSVQIKSAGELLRTYRLDYGEYGVATGRSHLTAVQEYGSDGVSTLPAQTFEWQQGGQGFGLQRWATQEGSWNGGDAWQTKGMFLTGDFDGDGRTDIAYVFNDGGFITVDVHLATGSSFAWQRWAQQQGGWIGGDDWQKKSLFLTGDFNGDGKTDIAYLFNDGGAITMDVHVSTGNSFVHQRWATQQGGWIGGDNWQQSAQFLIGDFNGDGKTDIAYVFHDTGATQTYDVHVSTGSSFVNERWATQQGGWIGGDNWQKSAQFLTGDFNGDGKTDIAYVFHDTGATQTYDVHVSTGSSFVHQRWATQQGGWIGGDNWQKSAQFLTGDFNGDGKTDIAYVFHDTGATQTYDVHVSTGSSFINERWATQQGGWIGGDSWQQSAQFFTGDFNGDGRTDIAYVFHDTGATQTYDVHVSTGNSLVNQRWATQQGGWIGGDGWQKSAQFFTGDFTGDGKTDIAYVFHDSGGTQTYDVHGVYSPSPDLMTKVNNGLGGTVTVAYAPSPQVPNAIVPMSSAPGIPNSAPLPLVIQVTTGDGRGGSYSTHSRYYDVRLYPGTVPEMRNLGFAYIDTVDDQTGQYTRKYFQQTPGYEGRLAQDDAYTAAGQLVSRTIHGYDLVYPSSGTELVRETEAIVTTYELGTPAFTQATTRVYDAYGNPVTVLQTADHLPDVTITTAFNNDPGRWILGRITEVKTEQTSGGAKTLGWVRNRWAGDVITQKSEWLDSTNAWVTTTMTYDGNGNLASVTEPSTGDGLIRTTTTAYDATFKTYPTKVKNALGHITERSYNAEGLIASVTDVNGRVTTTAYDALGRRSSETRPDGGITSYAYVNYGSPYLQYNATRTMLGSQVLESADFFDGTSFKYRTRTSGDDGKMTCVDRAKDAAGRTAYVSTPHFCEVPAAWTTTTYDGAGRVSSVRAPDGRVATYSYATDHVSVRDPAGRETTKYQDARQKTTAVLDTAGQTTSYEYDALGRLVSVKLPDGSVTTTAYDSLNRKTRVTDPHLGTTTYSYDAVGNLTSVSAAGKAVNFTYDALNRVSRKQPVGEGPVSYTYDEPAVANGQGRLTTLVDPGGTTRFAYTATGQVNNLIKTIDGNNYSQFFTYDTAGRLTQLTYPDGSYADYFYAGGRNLSSVSLNGAVYATWSNYNASGKPQNVAYGNRVGTAYSYDVVNRLASLVTTKGSTKLQDLTYAFDTGGLDIASITDNRVSKILTNGSSTDETQTYSYDALRRLTKAVGVWGTKSYAYDSVGNMTVFGGIVARTLAYSGQQVTSGSGLSKVAYDAAGNMTRKLLDGVLYKYTWTVENRLASVARRVLDSESDPGDDSDRGADDNGQVGDGSEERASSDSSQARGSDVGEGTRTLPRGRQDDADEGDDKVQETNCREGHGEGGEEDDLTVRNGSKTKTLMTYDADGQRVKKTYFFKPHKAVITTYIGRMYEKRVFPHGSQRHTINLYANGQLIATYTRAECIATATAPFPSYRQEAQLASMFSSSSALGAANKALHILGALVMHPKAALALYSTFALGMLAALAAPLLKRKRRDARRPHFGFGKRLASAFMILVFALGACSRNHDADHAHGPLSGDTLSGPAIGTYFYHRNHINSSTVVTDNIGNETTRYVYLPYGEISPANSSGRDTVTAKFTGQEYDEETGLYYYITRYYDPALGRFMSADAAVTDLTNAQAWNRYAYVNGNPIVYVDPTGQGLFDWIGDIWNAIKSAAGWVSNAVASAAKWIANAITDAANFLANAASYAWAMIKEMATNPAVIVSFIVAAGISIITLNPAPLAAWAYGMAAAIAAQSLAMAAGVRNPTVLAIIGAVAGAAAGAGSLSGFVKAIGTWGAVYGLAKLEGDRLARWMGPINSLGVFLVVNALVNSTFGPPAKDPSGNGPSEDYVGVKGGPDQGGGGGLDGSGGDAPPNWLSKFWGGSSLEFKLVMAGSLVATGVEVVAATLHLLGSPAGVALVANPWGAALVGGAILFGVGLAVAGGVLGILAVRDARASAGRLQRHRPKRRSRDCRRRIRNRPYTSCSMLVEVGAT